MEKQIVLQTIDESLAASMQNPEFRAEWERTAIARAVAIAVLRYRVGHKLSQTALGKLLGIPQPHVSRLEIGEHTPTIESLQRLSRILGLRFLIDLAPDAEAKAVALPKGLKVLQDITCASGGRVRVAAG